MKRLILVDGNSLMYRAYYGMANGKIMTNSKGIYTNAVYAFARMMNHLTTEEYNAILVAFDAGKKTFRHEFMQDYKAGRAPMPDEMRSQIAYIKQFLDLKRIKRFEISLYEADDIIGTVAKMGEDNGYHVDIYSSDKDLLQLISDKTTVHLTKKGITDLEDFDIKHFEEVYEIKVDSFVDLKALMGDKSDNIPGVPGIGEKKALKYLKEYHNIETLLNNLDNIKGADKAKLTENADVARLCKKMATILRDAPIDLKIDDIIKKPEDKELLVQFYQELEFNSFLKEVKKDISKTAYYIIKDENELKENLSIDNYLVIENKDYNYHKNEILAIALANDKGTFIIEPPLFKTITFKEFMESDNNKNVYDYKRFYVSLRHFGIETKDIAFDLLLATYIINSRATKKDFKAVADYYEANDIMYDDELYGKGAKRKVPELDLLYNNLAHKVNMLKKLKSEAIRRLESTNQFELLTDIEIPLSYTLGKMEYNGFKIDMEELNSQDEALSKKIKELEENIHLLAHKDFNISSPKQLATILFEDLKIPYPGNPKKGYSTEISILEAIKDTNPIVELVMEYRQITKLYGTYIEGLRKQIYPDGKVHTIFEQTLTETGRLSSVEPNLQNIPIRTEQGRLIRKMFIPSKEENSLYSADYSQIELRVLAALADVKNLVKAFNNNEDIHTATARSVFGHDDITSDERRKAKAVNFGIVYGISAYGLAKDIDVEQYEAREFIDNYNKINPEINIYMDKILEDCKENGYVTTIKNRRRYIPEINSKNYMERENAKRMAMNAPIQGSAADIIKIAMIEIDRELERGNYKSKMLVQVHDELVFEVYPDEYLKVKDIVRNKMNNAIKLSVPLAVGEGYGKDWYQLK